MKKPKPRMGYETYKERTYLVEFCHGNPVVESSFQEYRKHTFTTFKKDRMKKRYPSTGLTPVKAFVFMARYTTKKTTASNIQRGVAYLRAKGVVFYDNFTRDHVVLLSYNTGYQAQVAILQAIRIMHGLAKAEGYD